MAHGKSTVVKAISGVQARSRYPSRRFVASRRDAPPQTVRFKNELERNITIKLGYANAKIYKCEDENCPRPSCYRCARPSLSRCARVAC